MKRALALLIALCLLATSALAEDAGATQEVAAEKNGLTVIRMKTSGETDTMKYKVDYPTFEGEDTALCDYLKQTVTDPLLALRKLDAMSKDASVYTADTKDSVRMSFFASLDFDGVLSLEASVRNRAADQSKDEMLFFYRIIDLTNRAELTVYDLFAESREEVDKAVRGAVYAIEAAKGTALVTDAAQVPAPNSYYLSKDAFRCLFAAGTVEAKAVAVDIPWKDLPLTPSAVLSGKAALSALPDAAENADTEAAAVSASPEAGAAAGETVTDPAVLGALLTANDWDTDGGSLRFGADGSITDPTGAAPLFVSYAITDGKLYLTSEDRPDQGVTVEQTDGGLLLTFDPETSDYTTLALTVADPPAQAETTAPASATPVPLSQAVTPTPMPLSGDDADLVDFLSQGLWKRIGTDGETYYQFTKDGKLLTVEVSPYTVSEGSVSSDGISGEVAAGGTAFTVTQSDGTQTGYVLNRSATAIPAAEFVTPTPTPAPTPTPTPSPTPTPGPTPSPTPKPTPTLSPYEQAAQTAPSLAVLDDAAFTKRQTFKVYSAPDENSYRDSKAQVTTDDTVNIFGVTGKWLLVSYAIGNGSRGRIGYIGTGTLANPEDVAQLTFADITLTLTKSAKATDDPLNGKTTIFTLKKDASVKLLAFLGKDWAYVETTYKDKVCRAFIPRGALINE